MTNQTVFDWSLTMADPDIRRMSKKHKKYKKEHSQFPSYRLPGKYVFIVEAR